MEILEGHLVVYVIEQFENLRIFETRILAEDALLLDFHKFMSSKSNYGYRAEFNLLPYEECYKKFMDDSIEDWHVRANGYNHD